MSKLFESSMTIYEALQNILEGKYVMPAFQRQFVWGMEQIEKLWDSILQDYPIASFLFWHVDDTNTSGDTYFCEFLNNVTFDSRKQADSVDYRLTSINVMNTDTAVLDGQQRLTSLLISLFGEGYIRPTYARKKSGDKLLTKVLIELNKHKVSVDEDEYNSKAFDIKFSEKIGRLSPTQFEIKNIISSRFMNPETRSSAIEEAIVNTPADSKDYARNILKKLYDKIFVEKLISYTRIIDMNQDDALEMFVRFNSGGKSLKKSEITMAILEAYWPSAKIEFGKIFVDSYSQFGTEFIIRAALMLYGDVIKTCITKQMAENLKNDWGSFVRALRNMENMLKGLKIDVSRFSNSWNVLLPILYSIYYNPDYEKSVKSIQAYLLRAVFFTYFQSGTTAKLQQMKSNINNYDYEITIEMLDQMNELRITDGKIEDVLNSEKGSRVAGEVLYYLARDWTNKNYKYEQDHLHPDNRFNSSKPVDVKLDDWKKWRGMRNRIPNLHLLEGRSNGSKNDMRLVDYFNDMNDKQKLDFLDQAMIPDGVSLEFEKFDKFYEARKELLSQKIRGLLT